MTGYFSGETLVATPLGATPIATLLGGQPLVLSREGAWVKALVQHFGEHEVSHLTLSRSGALKMLRVTSTHPWQLRNLRGGLEQATTADLRPGYRLKFTFPARQGKLGLSRLGVARGFVHGDGSMSSPNRSAANFCGEKDEALLHLFEGLGRPPRRYGDILRITGLPGDWKREYPSLEGDASSLYGWLAGYFAADGDVDKTGRPTLSSASLEDLEFVRLACQTLGIGTFGIRTRMRTGYGRSASALHCVGLMRGDLDRDFFLIAEHRRRYEAGRKAFERRGWNVVSSESSGERAEVYSVATSTDHGFALSDNILATGIVCQSQDR